MIENTSKSTIDPNPVLADMNAKGWRLVNVANGSWGDITVRSNIGVTLFFEREAELTQSQSASGAEVASSVAEVASSEGNGRGRCKGRA